MTRPCSLWRRDQKHENILGVIRCPKSQLSGCFWLGTCSCWARALLSGVEERLEKQGKALPSAEGQYWDSIPGHPDGFCAARVTWGGLMQNKCPQVLLWHISPKQSFSAKPSAVILENHPAPLSHCISYFKECDF